MCAKWAWTQCLGSDKAAYAAVQGSRRGHNVRDLNMKERSSQRNIADPESLLNKGGSSKGQDDVKGLIVYLSL